MVKAQIKKLEDRINRINDLNELAQLLDYIFMKHYPSFRLNTKRYVIYSTSTETEYILHIYDRTTGFYIKKQYCLDTDTDLPYDAQK